MTSACSLERHDRLCRGTPGRDQARPEDAAPIAVDTEARAIAEGLLRKPRHAKAARRHDEPREWSGRVLSDPPQTPAVTAAYEDDLASDGYINNSTRVWCWRPDVLASFQALRADLLADRA